MITYPIYPQPVLTNPLNGLRYYLEMPNTGGAPSVKGPISERATDASRLKLVSTDRTASYQLALTSASNPSLTVRSIPAEQGGWEIGRASCRERV